MQDNSGTTDTIEEMFPSLRVLTGRHTVDVEVIKVGEQIHARTILDLSARPVMTVRSSEGWAAWGTRPTGVKKGDKIRLAATFEPSKKNHSFGFFSRPKLKAVIHRPSTTRATEES